MEELINPSKNDHIWKRGALWFQVEELINPSKISQILSAKKRGNYRLDRCFASNTSEDMLQPINKLKKKKKRTKLDWSGLNWTEMLCWCNSTGV